MHTALRRPDTILVVLLLLVSSAGTASAIDWTETPYQPDFSGLDARAAVLLEVADGSVLYARNRNEVLPPASIVKLFAMDILLERVKDGELDLDDDIPIPAAAWAQNAPPQSSLMFLGPGQRANVDDLLLGLAVPSGNDAAVAAALLLEDSIDAFVQRVNQGFAAAGYRNTRLVEPSGYSPENTSTAAELARFAREYVQRHPEAIERYHSIRTYGYPQPENLLPGNSEGVVMQQNYNRLLWIMPEADGLKTGTIPEVGYNLAATAERDGRRLIAIVLGVQADNPLVGNRLRAEQARDLLEYGFREYATEGISLPDPGSVRLYGAAAREVGLYIDAPWHGTPFSIPRGIRERVSAHLELPRRLHGGVTGDAPLGRIIFSVDGRELAAAPLRTEREVPAGAWYQRLLGWLQLLIERIRGNPFPPTEEQLPVLDVARGGVTPRPSSEPAQR